MRPSKTIVLGSDHAGFRVKNYVKSLLEKMDYRIEDVGTYDTKPVDYPDYAEKVALEVLKVRGGKGILACGTGIGASIAANKIPGIWAALICDVKDARLSREHNDANVLVLGGWGFDKAQVRKILQFWLHRRFRGGRHRRRTKKIAQLEKKYLARSSLRHPR